MRTIKRDIVGAFLFSADGKVLLGHSKPGGTYQGMLIIPGGGIELNETLLEALKREIFEEIGLDITHCSIRQLGEITNGESKKTLKETGEEVLVEMTFHDFEVKLSENADSVHLTFDDDFGNARWYEPAELQNAPIGSNAKAVLQRLHFL